jgi:putative MATE family efflux protein
MEEEEMRDLTVGRIDKNIVDLAIPMIGGQLMFTLFNITDTYFVGKLGTEALAAMGFTFPVILIASALTMGISTGSMSVLSRAAGNNDRYIMKRTATDGLILSLLFVILFSVVGLNSMDSIFTLLGADKSTLPIIKEYMTIWYSFSFVVFIPPVSDSSMRALGDMVRPFYVMCVCALMNVVLDPILIFGYFGFPAMGIRGAAIATVISRACGMCATLYFLNFHHKLLELRMPKISELISSWKKILIVGIPAVGVAIFPQLLRSFITAQAAYVGGVTAVAAVAAGSRIEGFAYIITQSVGSSLVPIIGQNWGAKKAARIEETRRFYNKHSLTLGIAMFVVIFFISDFTAKLFTQDAEVLKYTSIYLKVLLAGAIGMNLYTWNGQALNAVGKSFWSLVINGGGTVVFMMPVLYLGSRYSFTAMIGGLAVGQIIVGLISIFIARSKLKFEDGEKESILSIEN